MKILETKRLLLRHQTPADLDALWALYCNPSITKYIPDAPRSYEEAREELEWFMNGHPTHPELGLWATVYKENARFIGRCGLLPGTIDGRYEVEVAYTIAEDYWGRGLATEAALGIVEYAFGRLGLSRLVCTIEHGNAASMKVAANIGMTFEKEAEDDKGPFLLYSMSKPAGLSPTLP